MTGSTTTVRPLYEIAAEVKVEWSAASKNGVSPYAKPYLDAMFSLDKVTDMYGCDDAKEIVLRFLSNATSFKGEAARALKAELKGMLK